jgi:hypothetical protein
LNHLFLDLEILVQQVCVAQGDCTLKGAPCNSDTSNVLVQAHCWKKQVNIDTTCVLYYGSTMLVSIPISHHRNWQALLVLSFTTLVWGPPGEVQGLCRKWRWALEERPSPCIRRAGPPVCSKFAQQFISKHKYTLKVPPLCSAPQDSWKPAISTEVKSHR